MALIGPGAGRRNAATSELAIDAGGNMATMGDWDTQPAAEPASGPSFPSPNSPAPTTSYQQRNRCAH